MKVPAMMDMAVSTISDKPAGQSIFPSGLDGMAKSFAQEFAGILNAKLQTSPSTTATALDAGSGQASNQSNMGASTATAANPPSSSANAYFFGYNGKAYPLAPPTGDSFEGSNGQTYTRQEIKDFYAKNPNFGDDIAMMAKLGLKYPDLYKARYLAGQSDTNGTGIFADPKELTQYSNYMSRATATEAGASAAMSFDQWRSVQDPTYLASLQVGPNDNIAWVNGPAGGVAVGGAGSGGSTSTLALAALKSNPQNPTTPSIVLA